MLHLPVLNRRTNRGDDFWQFAVAMNDLPRLTNATTWKLSQGGAISISDLY